MLDATPMGHRGSPQDIAHGVPYPASFVTSTELVVDGGCTTV
ncbi:hypothetical protein ACWEQP_24325 [Streptomyces sp. NPDC004044]